MRRLPILLLLAVAAPGCAESARPSFTITDSAGVRIALSELEPRVYARLAAEPALSLGSVEASGPTQFSGIRGLHVDAQGRIWVVDGGSAEIRVFGADGGHLLTVGNPGDGPGEFRRPRMLGGFGGDSVAVWDDAHGRLSVIEASGRIAYEKTLGTGRVPFYPRRVLHDGSLLGQEMRILQARELSPGTVIPDTARLRRLDVRTGAMTPLGDLASVVWLWNGRSQLPFPFTANVRASFRNDTLHFNEGPDFRLGVRVGGRLVASYGVRRFPRPVTAAEVRRYREATTAAIADTAYLLEYLSPLDHPDLPKQLPAYYELVRAETGELWARHYTPDLLDVGTWDVYAPDMRWLGTVETPARFDVEVITAGSVIGVWRDDLDVEHVRVYPLEVTAGPALAGGRAG